MNYKEMLNKMEKIFIKLGFEPVIINNVTFMRYKGCYCKVTFLEAWKAFVIESAENLQDAEKGLLEDGDLYFTDMPESELLNRFRNDLIKYYMDD